MTDDFKWDMTEPDVVIEHPANTFHIIPLMHPVFLLQLHLLISATFLSKLDLWFIY